MPATLCQRLRAALRPFHLDWLQVEVSSRCDGRCVYCPVSRLRGRRRETFMSMPTFEAIEPFFPDVDLVFLQGWGEPLLHPRFWELVERARDAGPEVGFTTNGVLLDADNRRALLESGVDVLGVSLVGSTPATHDRYRLGSPLAVIDHNLRRLRAEKEAAGARTPELHLAYLMLAGNAGELAGAVELADRWGAAEVVVSQLALVLDASLEEESLLARPDAWPRLQETMADAEALAEAKGIRLHSRAPRRERDLLCGENVQHSSFVSVDGRVSPCVMANVGLDDGAERESGRRGEDDAARGSPAAGPPPPGRFAAAVRSPGADAPATHRFRGREVPLETLTFGNVRDRPLPEIWRSDAARSFRHVFRDRVYRGRDSTEPLPEPCRRCWKLLER